MNEPVQFDVDLDPSAPKTARKGFFVVGPSGDFSFHPAGRDGRVLHHSVLISSGGRTFVNGEGGRRSKAALGFALLKVGENCTAAEMRTLTDWQAASDRGEAPEPIALTRLPKIIIEKRAEHLKKHPRIAAKVKPAATTAAPAK